MNPIDQLKAVLCDPSGKCCIDGSDEDRAIIDRALQALAQPEQEPVAYLNIEIEGTGGYLDWDNDIPASWYKSIPLYTAPPKREWVGLTHDDIENLWNGVQWSISDFVIPFTRAVEAKLKEKNGAI